MDSFPLFASSWDPVCLHTPRQHSCYLSLTYLFFCTRQTVVSNTSLLWNTLIRLVVFVDIYMHLTSTFVFFPVLFFDSDFDLVLACQPTRLHDLVKCDSGRSAPDLKGRSWCEAANGCCVPNQSYTIGTTCWTILTHWITLCRNLQNFLRVWHWPSHCWQMHPAGDRHFVTLEPNFMAAFLRLST